MQPGFGRDELAQEQRRGDGAALAAAADIVGIGYLGIEHRLIGPPQRHAPERIVLGYRAARDFIGKRIVVGEKRRHLGPERHSCSTCERGEVDDQHRLVLVGERERVGQHQSALGVGIADLDADAFARCVDVARAEAGARDGILHRRDDHAQPHLELARHDHVRQRQGGGAAGHVLLHVEHAGVVLDVEPAGVEAHALADQRDLRVAVLAPGDVDQPGAARRAGADRGDQRELLGERVASGDFHGCAMLLGERAGGVLQLGRAHVVGRRVDEIARQRHAFQDAAEILSVHTLRDHQPYVAHLRLAVAGESIGAEREGQRRQPRVMRRVGETVSARRQQGGQLPGPEQVFHRLVGVFQAEQHAGQFAVRRRHREIAPGLGLISGGVQEHALAVVDDLGCFVESGGGDEQDRHRKLAGTCEDRMHGYSAASRMDGFGA